MPLTISISRLICRSNVYINIRTIKGAKVVGKEGLIFVVVYNTRGKRSVNCREVNNVLVK